MIDVPREKWKRGLCGLRRLCGHLYPAVDRAGLPDLGVPPVEVVAVHERLDPRAELAKVREGVVV